MSPIPTLNLLFNPLFGSVAFSILLANERPPGQERVNQDFAFYRQGKNIKVLSKRFFADRRLTGDSVRLELVD